MNNKIYFAQTDGSAEPKALCERHAGEESPFEAVSEPLDDTDEPCAVCAEKLTEEFLEIATEIIDPDGRGLRRFLNMVAGLLEARADAGDASSELFRAGFEGLDRAAENVAELEFDKFDEGDAVLFAREVTRHPYFTVPMGARGRLTLIRGESVCVTLDREASGRDSQGYSAVWFEGVSGRFEFLGALRKLPPPSEGHPAGS